VISFLLSNWDLLGLAAAAAAAFVAVGMLGGWPLVLNRRVVGALVAVLAVSAAAMWLRSRDESLREEGRAECRAANRAAQDRRREDISEFVVGNSRRESDLRARLRAAEGRIELDRLNQKRSPRVTQKADSSCTLTLGFVRDYDASLPGASGRPAVPAAVAGGDDDPAGISVSRASAAIGDNNAVCAVAVGRLAACEERRFKACVAWDEKFGTKSGCSK
jgi:signal transduction histidine kinase